MQLSDKPPRVRFATRCITRVAFSLFCYKQRLCGPPLQLHLFLHLIASGSTFPHYSLSCSTPHCFATPTSLQLLMLSWLKSSRLYGLLLASTSVCMGSGW